MRHPNVIDLSNVSMSENEKMHDYRFSQIVTCNAPVHAELHFQQLYTILLAQYVLQDAHDITP